VQGEKSVFAGQQREPTELIHVAVVAGSFKRPPRLSWVLDHLCILTQWTWEEKPAFRLRLRFTLKQYAVEQWWR